MGVVPFTLGRVLFLLSPPLCFPQSICNVSVESCKEALS